MQQNVSQRNYHNHVPAHKRQSISKGELRGVLHALLQRQPWETLVVVRRLGVCR